ncbi:MAG: single-stranded-DNA-specific exonuclease RecJ [bacterium]|nr:single-stranded-DNA-specific exonuclease RecJ [bacterium]
MAQTESILERRIEPRWVFAQRPDTEHLESTKQALGVPTALAKILINRNLSDVEQAKAFLYPSLDHLIDPFQMADMEAAVDRIWEAVDAGEKIMVHGDYDVDGVTGTSLLVRAFQALGADVDFYIPNRLEDGYGISKRGIEEGVRRGIRLLVSVDCGITAVQEAEYARKKGLDVIITDHHQPGTLPNALAVVNPKRQDCDYPFKELSGVALAFKLAYAVYQKRDVDRAPVLDNLDLVALGCAADIVPLVGENRVLVTYGLERMHQTENLGLRALLENLGLKGGQLTTEKLIFVLAPRINALGRMGSAMEAVTLLTTSDKEEAERIALMLEKKNQMRRRIDERMLREALKQVEIHVHPDKDRAVVLASEDWHPGVIGIVATRIAEKVHLPTVMISVDGKSSKGSGRSIPGFDLYAALSRCQDHLVAFGGHKYAAGLTIEPKQIEAFRDVFLEVAKEMMVPDDLVPKLYIEGEILLNQINRRLVDVLNRFAPFGAQNTRPVMVSRNVEVVGAPSIVGKNHLKFKARQSDQVFDCIGFNLGHLIYRLTPGEANLDMAYMIEENEWRGRKGIQLRIKDLR